MQDLFYNKRFENIIDSLYINIIHGLIKASKQIKNELNKQPWTSREMYDKLIKSNIKYIEVLRYIQNIIFLIKDNENVKATLDNVYSKKDYIKELLNLIENQIQELEKKSEEKQHFRVYQDNIDFETGEPKENINLYNIINNILNEIKIKVPTIKYWRNRTDVYTNLFDFNDKKEKTSLLYAIYNLFNIRFIAILNSHIKINGEFINKNNDPGESNPIATINPFKTRNYVNKKIKELSEFIENEKKLDLPILNDFLISSYMPAKHINFYKTILKNSLEDINKIIEK